MFKTQVEPLYIAAGEWFHGKVLNIFTSFLWSVRVQTMEIAVQLSFYNNIDNFGRSFPSKILRKSSK